MKAVSKVERMVTGMSHAVVSSARTQSATSMALWQGARCNGVWRRVSRVSKSSGVLRIFSRHAYSTGDPSFLTDAFPFRLNSRPASLSSERCPRCMNNSRSRLSSSSRKETVRSTPNTSKMVYAHTDKRLVQTTRSETATGILAHRHPHLQGTGGQRLAARLPNLARIPSLNFTRLWHFEIGPQQAAAAGGTSQRSRTACAARYRK